MPLCVALGAEPLDERLELPPLLLPAAVELDAGAALPLPLELGAAAPGAVAAVGAYVFVSPLP